MVCNRVPHVSFPGVTPHQVADLSTDDQGGQDSPLENSPLLSASGTVNDGYVYDGHSNHQYHYDQGATATRRETGLWQAVEHLMRTGSQQLLHEDSRAVLDMDPILASSTGQEQELWSLIETGASHR